MKLKHLLASSMFLFTFIAFASFVFADCFGFPSLTLNPSTVSANGLVTPSASGLSGCDRTVYFTRGSGCPDIGVPAVSSCTVSGDGCIGPAFAAPSSAGGYYYTLCIDKNGDGNYDYKYGEMGWAILTVTNPNPPVNPCPTSCNTHVTVSVYPETINAGQSITINGRVTSTTTTDCGDPAVYLYLDGSSIGTTHTDSYGYYTYSYTTSSSISAGSHRIKAVSTIDCCSEGYAIDYFTVKSYQPPCARSAPTVSITPSSQQGSAGSILSYTVTVTNNDNSYCGSSAFSLSPYCPSGWRCYLDQGSLSIYPGYSGSTSMRLTSPTTATSTQSTQFSLIATNGYYPYYSATGYATYTVYPSYPSCSYSLSTSPSSGSYSDSDRSWYIFARDYSSGCASPVTYSVSYSTSGDCDSSTSASPSSFTISQGSTLSNAVTVRVVRRTNACTLSLTIRSPSGSTIASGSYILNPSAACVGRYLDSYSCSGNDLQQLYQNSDCTTYWVTKEHSSSYCSSGQYAPYTPCYYNAPCYNNYVTPTYIAPTYVLPSDAGNIKEIEVARAPSQPYEGEIPKAQAFSTTEVSTHYEGILIIGLILLFLLLIILLLVLLFRKSKGIHWGIGNRRRGRGDAEGFDGGCGGCGGC